MTQSTVQDNKILSLPQDKFDVILADPPWRYDFSSTKNRKIENQYPTMDVEDICKMSIPSSDNCVLFLWSTMPKLKEALKVIDAWGFQYKTGAVWDKMEIGMGYYFRGQHELLLVATKGNPPIPFPENRVSSVIKSPRTSHSTKPKCVYDIIKKMYPNGKYIELFARKEYDTFVSWGNNVERTVKHTTIKNTIVL